MNRRLWAIALVLLAVILLHDVSMATVGHPVASPSMSAPDFAHHPHDAPTPERDACDTVRAQYLRLPDPDLSAGPDVRPSHAPLPIQWSDSAISDAYLIVSVLPPPSACLALFQSFLI